MRETQAVARAAPVPMADKTPERIGPSLYRRGGMIYARIRDDGKRTYRSTGTNDPATARKVLRQWQTQQVLKSHGIEPKVTALQRQRLTVEEVIAAYIEAGCPTRKMKAKMPQTVTDEIRYLNPVRSFFGQRAAVTLELSDCDKYRDWRNSGGYVSVFKVRGHEVTKRTRGGDRGVDCELQVLSNSFNLAVRRGLLKTNPLAGRGRYTSAADIRHCREVAPTPEGLQQIEHWLRLRGEQDVADLVSFLAYSGLRIGEAMPLEWEAVNWGQGVLHVQREKRGIIPWVPILPEMETLLREMQKRATSHLLFPSPLAPDTSRDHSAIRRRMDAACKALGIGHVTPHGLRSYFVTQARQSGLTDAEIAMLIGDKTGPSLIASTYGDVRPDHLLKQARRIQLRATERGEGVHTVAVVR